SDRSADDRIAVFVRRQPLDAVGAGAPKDRLDDLLHPRGEIVGRREREDDLVVDGNPFAVAAANRELDDVRCGGHVGSRFLGQHRLPLSESRTIEAYSAGASSQTKWPASMIARRLLSSRSWRNSALATGTTRSVRPLMIVTCVPIRGSSSASSGSSSGYLRT